MLAYPLVISLLRKAANKLQICRLFMVLFAVYSLPVQADTVPDLYDVDILVTDESNPVRQQAFSQGLDEVFIRISGDSIVMEKLKRPPASRYVKRFSYVPVDEPTTNEQGDVLSHRLKLQYNGSLMEKYLIDNGFSVWGEHRANTVVWMVVRDGSNEYVLKNSDSSLIKSVTAEAMQRRGIPERWPLFDTGDRKKVSIADLRGGFQDQVIEASRRYSYGPSLTASLNWNGRKWQSNWSLLMATGNRHWSLEDNDYQRLINKAIDQAADAMGVVFAINARADKQSLATIKLNVQGVSSIVKYRQLQEYLTELSAVDSAKTLMVDGKSVEFELLLRSEKKAFFSLLKNDATLTKMAEVAIQDEAIKPTFPVVGNDVQTDVNSIEQQPVKVEPKELIYQYRLNI